MEQRVERKCRTCQTWRTREDFKDAYAKRCLVCVRVAHNTPCRSCGKPSGVTADGLARAYCAEPECQAAQRSEATNRLRVKQKRHIETRANKRCPACAEVKPIETGWHNTRSPYCLSCTRVDQRQRYRSSADRRLRARQRAAESKARKDARRKIDPEFDAQVRAASRERSRRLRNEAKVRADLDPVVEVVVQGQRLPAKPLGEWIRRHVHEYDDMKDMGTRLGYDGSGLYKIMVGKVQMVHACAVDRILCNAQAPHLAEALYGEDW